MSDPKTTQPEPCISVIVVSYNTRALTLACLASLFEQTREHTIEVLLVDNGSADGSVEAVASQYPQVRLLAMERNLGFAVANNLAARQARGTWLLLLNPDTLVLDRAVDRLVRFAEATPDAGIFGGRTLFADHTLNITSCWRKPSMWSLACIAAGLSSLFRGSGWFNPEAMPRWKRDSARCVDIVTGCFLMLKRSLWEQLRGFDPAFFMYGEDADLCLRAARAGVRAVICPEATIVHIGGASERARAPKMIRLFAAKAQFFRRHWSPLAARFGISMLDVWTLTRWAVYAAAGMVSPSAGACAAAWREIWRGRHAWHESPQNPPAPDMEAMGRLPRATATFVR